MPMNNGKNVIIKDLDDARKSLERQEFDSINIVGNRLMTNLLVNDRKDLMIVGWILKDLSVNLNSIKIINSEDIIRAVESTLEYLNNIKDMVNSDLVQSSLLWDNYFTIENNLRRYLLRKDDRDNCIDNNEFSRDFALFMLSHFYSNRELLFRGRNNIISGITVEVNRVANEHGGKEIMIIYLIFKGLDAYYRYLKLESELNNLDGKIVPEEQFKNLLEKIYKLILLIEEDRFEDLCSSSQDILGELGLEYRKYYINYLDPQLYEGERKIELPEKAKEKIGDIIAKSFQKKRK